MPSGINDGDASKMSQGSPQNFHGTKVPRSSSAQGDPEYSRIIKLTRCGSVQRFGEDTASRIFWQYSPGVIFFHKRYEASSRDRLEGEDAVALRTFFTRTVTERVAFTTQLGTSRCKSSLCLCFTQPTHMQTGLQTCKLPC